MDEATELLRISERRLRLLFDSIDDGYCLCEMVTDESGRGVDYRFLEINPLFEEMTGLLDPVGRTALELVPDLESVWIDQYARVGLGQETVRFQQGSEAMGRWFDVFAVPMEPHGHFAIVFRDRTAAHTAEEALKARAATDAFRVALGDAMRILEDPVEVQAVAAQMLGTHLGASRALYCEVMDDEVRLAAVHADYHPETFSIVGQHVLDNFGKAVMDDFRAGRAVSVEDAQNDPRLTLEERAMTKTLNIGAHILMPLMKDGRPVAGLVAHSIGPREWSKEELDVVAETAERTWASIQRLNAERDLRVRRERAELLTEILSTLEGYPTAAAQMQHLTDLLVPVLADYATVEVPSREEKVSAVTHRDPARAALLRSVRENHLSTTSRAARADVVAGAPQLTSVVTADLITENPADPATAEMIRALSPRSHMAVPLSLGGVAGQIMVGITSPDRPYYTQDDLVFLQEVARRVEVIMAADRVRRQEHDIAVRLQRALLPDRVIQHPSLAIEARYEAAGELLQVGGDWYDTFSWPDGRIGVIVGDVVGHNLDSAATMGRLRAATAALATHVPPSPAAVLDALATFTRGPDGATFVTAACVVVDPLTGVLTHSSAGHPPVLVLPPAGPAVRLSAALAPPMCDLDLPLPPSGRPESTHQLAPGSVVVLYSDGLIERRGESIGVGLDRLEVTASALAGEPLPALADALVTGMAALSPSSDDVVVACLRWTP